MCICWWQYKIKTRWKTVGNPFCYPTAVQIGNRMKQRLHELCHVLVTFAMQEDTDRKYGNRIRLPGSKEECACLPVDSKRLAKFLYSSGCVGVECGWGWWWSVSGGPQPQWDLNSNSISASCRILKLFQVSAHTDRRGCFIYASVSQSLWDRGPVNSFFIRWGPSPNRFS